MDYHQIGIKCRTCNKKWKINIPITGNSVEIIASICECATIIVGNYNAKLILEDRLQTKIKSDWVSLDEKYLSNGSFDFFYLSSDDDQLPELILE